MRALRLLLLPVSFLYGTGVIIRNWFFDIGLLKVTKTSVPVISVGNLSAGGTGKTPLVEWLAARLRAEGRTVAIVSRGYRRSTTGYVVVSNGVQRCAEAEESGDEPAQMAEKLDGVVVVVDENRVRAAQNVTRDFNVDVIVLDDALQHRYLHRDSNIVLVTAKEVNSFSAFLPAGDRREPLSALRRADVIVVSRWTTEEELEQAHAALARWKKPVVGARVQAAALVRAGAQSKEDVRTVTGKKVVAFSGIGQPESFDAVLHSLSVRVAVHHRFPDHHRYRQHDLQTVAESFKQLRADCILTTEKDLARVGRDPMVHSTFFQPYPVFAVQIVSNLVGEDALMNELRRVLA